MKIPENPNKIISEKIWDLMQLLKESYKLIYDGQRERKRDLS